MPSTRRSLLAAAVVAASGCASFDPDTDERDPNETTTTDAPTETPSTPESSGDTAFVHWSRDLPHDDLGLLSLGGGPEAPLLFAGSARAAADSEDGDGDTDHVLYALSLQEGNDRWRVDLPDPPRTAPMYAGKEDVPRVVFASGGESLDGASQTIHAVDPDSGEEAWTFDIDDRRYLYPIVTTDETVYVGRRAAEDHQGDEGDEDGEFVYALDAVDGTERWRVVTGGVTRRGNARGRDTLLVTTVSGVRALDMDDGEERWRADADSVAYDSRAERLFVQADATVRGLTLKDGDEQWRRDFDVDISPITTPRAAMDDTVFVGDADGRLHALSPRAGDTRWTLSVADGQFRPTVARSSERLYVAGGGLHAVEPVSGEREWSFGTADSLQVYGDAPESVFAGTDRRLWALDPSTGDERWAFAPEGEFAGVAAAGTVAFVAVDGTVYALEGTDSE